MDQSDSSDDANHAAPEINPSLFGQDAPGSITHNQLEPDSRSAPAIFAEVIDNDVICRKCRYNLRGLRGDGLCPECGSPVLVSLASDHLHFSDPRWLKRLRRGAAYMFTGAVIFTACLAVLLCLFGLLLLSPSVEEHLWLEGFAKTIWVSVEISFLLAMLGSWQITCRDPIGLGEDRYGKSRMFIRAGVAVAAIGVVTRSVLVLNLLPWWIRNTSGLQALFFLAAAIIRWTVELYFIKKLSLRIPDQTLSSRSRSLMKALIIGVIVAVLTAGVIVLIAISSRGSDISEEVIEFCLAVIGISFFIFCVVYASMLRNLTRRLSQQVGIAQLAWKIRQI